MNAILNVLKGKEIVILLGAALILIVLIVIISIIEKKKSSKSNIVEIDNVLIEPKTIVLEENAPENIVTIESPEILEIEVLEDTRVQVQEIIEEEIEKQEAKMELERVYDELKEKEEKKTDILEDTLTKFELEQEESAIISYEELKKVSEDLYKKNELLYESEEEAPLTIEELRSKFETASITKEKSELEEFIKIMDQEEVEELDVEYKKFDPIPFISPVYGFDNKCINPCVEMELENTANLEKLDAEIRKSSEYRRSFQEAEKSVD
jgi:hypothetical protein